MIPIDPESVTAGPVPAVTMRGITKRFPGVVGGTEVLGQVAGGLEPGGLLELDVGMLGRLIRHRVLKAE